MKNENQVRTPTPEDNSNVTEDQLAQTKVAFHDNYVSAWRPSGNPDTIIRGRF